VSASDDLEDRIDRVPDAPPSPAPEESIDEYAGVVVMRVPIGDDDLSAVDSWISARKEEWQSTEPALED
jgi:hypothetical protein